MAIEAPAARIWIRCDERKRYTITLSLGLLISGINLVSFLALIVRAIIWVREDVSMLCGRACAIRQLDGDS